MRILGIDPGLRNLGWGVIESHGSRLRHVANGVCTSDGDDLGERLLSLHNLAYVLRLMTDARRAISEHRFGGFRAEVVARRSAPSPVR